MINIGLLSRLLRQNEKVIVILSHHLSLYLRWHYTIKHFFIVYLQFHPLSSCLVFLPAMRCCAGLFAFRHCAPTNINWFWNQLHHGMYDFTLIFLIFCQVKIKSQLYEWNTENVNISAKPSTINILDNWHTGRQMCRWPRWTGKFHIAAFIIWKWKWLYKNMSHYYSEV